VLDASEERGIGHIELADWAEVVLVAPATADLMARAAGGIADDLVTTVLLATRAPLVMAPAMNVNMWEHPATRSNAGVLCERGVQFVGPDSGDLACGWQGAGRMAEPEAMIAAVERAVGPRSLQGERVLVTAGGTQEPLDPVRSLGNRSSGKMGYAVAEEAARRGAEVVLISAPTALPTPPGVTRIDVQRALEMRDAVLAEFDTATVLVMAAAVADFRPAETSTDKIKKETLDRDSLTVTLVRNPDILAEVSRMRGARVVVGFAAESSDLERAARRKLERKGCDLLVANDISRADAGFETDENAVLLLSPGEEVEALPLMPKSEVAGRILDRVEKLRSTR
jgi:phosphopantothenoylcysteine decarboxylase/phosphopantothenate--cysteine ligase